MATTNERTATASPPTEITSDSPPPIDGRRARGARNKSAVVAALLELYQSGEVQPSAARIASMAGVSERSVFRYFDDMEDLATTAVAIQWDRVVHFYTDLSPQGTFQERLAAIVDHRLALYDKVSGVFRVSMIAAVRIGTAAQAVEQRRDYLRRQARKQFRSEIDSQTDPAIAAAIVDYSLSLENIDYLRRSLGLSESRIKDVITENLRCVLAA